MSNSPESKPPRLLFLAPPLERWNLISPNIRGACFVVVGAFLLIVMASLVKHLGKTLPAFEVLFVRFLAGLIVIRLAHGPEDRKNV